MPDETSLKRHKGGKRPLNPGERAGVVTAKLPLRTLERLHQLAGQRGTSTSALVRELVEAHLADGDVAA